MKDSVLSVGLIDDKVYSGSSVWWTDWRTGMARHWYLPQLLKALLILGANFAQYCVDTKCILSHKGKVHHRADHEGPYGE